MKCFICDEEGHAKPHSKATSIPVSAPKVEAETDIKAKASVKLEGEMSDIKVKSQRKTKNLGKNTANTQDASYAAIEAKSPTARCSDGNHEGERTLPIRNFYLNKGGMGLQGACIICQGNRRTNRIKRSRKKFQGKPKEEICDMYLNQSDIHSLRR